MTAQAIPLAEAVICVNCDTVITRTTDSRCPKCLSEATMHLGTITGKSEELPTGPHELDCYVTRLEREEA